MTRIYAFAPHLMVHDGDGPIEEWPRQFRVVGRDVAPKVVVLSVVTSAGLWRMYVRRKPRRRKPTT